MSKTLLKLLRLTAIVALWSVAGVGNASYDPVFGIHNDFAGNPIAATDAAGAILWKENFRPYGERLNNPPAASGNRQWFHGKAVDQDTGLSYFGARYYDPTLGRFMGIDSAGFKEENLHSFNRYAYGNNNPYKFTDPDGNAVETIVDAISFGISLAEFKANPTLLNGAALAYDGLALAVPILPGGAGLGLKAIKGADRAADALRTADKTENAAKYSGGAYGKLDRVEGLERHHMPADSASPISRSRGPAIQMEAADHARTSSYGSSASLQRETPRLCLAVPQRC